MKNIERILAVCKIQNGSPIRY